MKQLFLKFLLVFFVVSQLIIMPVQTAFANDIEVLNVEQIEADIAENTPSGQQAVLQPITRAVEGKENEPPAQIEAPKQETVQQETPKQVEQQGNASADAIVPLASNQGQEIYVNMNVDIKGVQELKNDGDIIGVKIDWSVPEGMVVKGGDYFTIPVSSQLAVQMKNAIDLGNEASCELQGNNVVCTFKDYVEGKVGIKGQLGFGGKLVSNMNGQGQQTLNISVAGKTVDITVETGSGEVTGPNTPRDVFLDKRGDRNLDGKNPDEITWTVFINEKRAMNLGEVTIYDVLGKGHEMIDGSLMIDVDGTYVYYNNQIKNQAMYNDLVIEGITLSNKELNGVLYVDGRSVTLTYKTKITDENVEEWNNSASIKAHLNNKTVTSKVENYSFGSAQSELAKYNGKFIVTKVNEAGEALAGATFTFTNGTQTYTLTTDETGKASTGEIPGGIYTLTETTAPAGYTIAEEYAAGKEITVNFKDNKTVEQTVVNKATEEPKGAIEIVKKQQAEEVTSQVEEGVTMTLQTVAEKTLAGAEFTVTNATGKVVATLITGEDGTAKADNLPIGAYTVTETKAPAGYVLDATPFTVKVTAGEVATQTVYNKQEKPQFTCPKFTVTVKGNGTNKDVVRPNITVTAEKEGKQIEFGVTNKDGQVIIDRSKLEAGTYTFTAKDNDGKVVSTQTITITNEECAAELNLATDKCERFEITITKDNQPVPNKKYVVVKDNIRLELATDENGKMYIPNTVEEGTYTLIDAEDEEQFKEITVSFDGECGTTLELPLVPVIKGCERFEVTVKENGEVVANTTYELHQEGNVITTVTTDGNGKFSVDRDTVTIGDYELVKDGKKVADIKVEYENCEFEVDTTVENTCPKFEITVNENSKAVANATYTATNGESVLTITTDDNGKFVIDRTEVVTGTYVVTQGEKVVGEFTVTEADCEAVVNVTPKYSCEKYEVIVVTEGDNTVRPGLDVTLQGKEELKGTTDKDGKVSFDRENVPAGDYKVIVDGEEIKTITIVDEDCKVTIELPKVETPTTPEKPVTPVDPEKPTTPVDPEKPTTPVDPEKPVTPVDPEKPTTPVDPEEPTTPVDPEEPTTPVDPEKPTTPVDPEKPTTPVDPEKPTTPVDPEKPTTPVDPEEPTTPVNPEKPTTPVDPEKPTTPVDPEKPTTPVDPEKPTTPVDPEKPTTPVDPEKPTTPVNPEKPTTPVDPEKPGKPEDKPQEPTTPEVTPTVPEKPTKPEEKPSTGGGGGGDKPAPQPEKPEVKPEKPTVEVPNENPKPGKPEDKPQEPTTPEVTPTVPEKPTKPEEKPSTGGGGGGDKPAPQPEKPEVKPEKPTVEVPNENPKPGKPEDKPQEPTVPEKPTKPEEKPSTGGGGGGDKPAPQPEKPEVKPEKPTVEVPNENPKPGKPEDKPQEPTTPDEPSVEIPNENPNSEKPTTDPESPVLPEQPTVSVPNENPKTDNEQPTVTPNEGNPVGQPTASVPAKELPNAGVEQVAPAAKLPQTDGESTIAFMLTGFMLVGASILLFMRRKQLQ